MSENPFCTGRIRPGALPFFFPAGLNAEKLAEQLRQSGGWGEIVGRHGTGKSALLATLIPAIERAGQRVLALELHDDERCLPLDLDRRHRVQPFALLVIDGYEQLGRFCRWRLRRRCRRRGWGLLVTTHKSVGLPELFHTVATPELAEQIVRHLLGGRLSPFTPADVLERYERRRGDMREMLFDLYDLFEARDASSGQKLN